MFLTSTGFSIFLAAIFGILCVIFFAGKGQKIIDGFGGKQQYSMKVTKKRTPEENRKYQRALAIFMLVLTINELLMGIFAAKYTWVALVAMIVTLVALIVLIVYLRAKFPN